MWKKHYIYLILAATIALLGLLIGPTSSWAVSSLCVKGMTATSEDSDKDGFTNYQECMLNGVVTPLDKVTKIWGQSQATLLKTPINCASPPAGNICLDPDHPDLFVVLVSNPTSTLMPTNPLQYFTTAMGYNDPNNLKGMIIHQLNVTKAPLDRTVFSGSTQKAVMVTESRDITSWDVLGISNTGLPGGLDQTTIYTDRIKNAIMKACGCTGTYSVAAGAPYYGLNCTAAIGSTYGTTKCADSTGVSDNVSSSAYNLTNKYIQHTIAHEIGHVLGPLAPNYDANYGGYHYMPGTNVIMDQSIYYTYSKSTNTTTFYIGVDFTATDKSAAHLIP
jgi:hypothetical protein